MERSFSHITFGQLDSNEDVNIRGFKRGAWVRVCGDEHGGSVLQSFVVAIADKIKQLALATNENEGEFVWRPYDRAWQEMVITDGCFFLHLALAILGCREELAYDPNHVLLGKDTGRQYNDCMRVMFTIHNKIPLWFLHTLMNQKFFKNVLSKTTQKWKTFSPSNLCEKALYELLVFPLLNKNSLFSPITCFRKGSTTTECSPQNVHIVHSLQNLLILGPKDHHLFGIEHDIDRELVDLEENGGSPNMISQKDDKFSTICPLVSELGRSRIWVKKLESGGIRSLDFKRSLFGANLYLPTFLLDGNTEEILQSLISYEKKHFRYAYQREVSSYIKFMSSIVHTRKDAELLRARKIVLGDPVYDSKLPAILRRLTSADDIVMTNQLQTVRRLTRDYDPWFVLKGALSITLVLTIFQTALAILTYFNIVPSRSTAPSKNVL